LESPLRARVAGRLWCGLSSAPGGPQWKEPFLARFYHAALRPALEPYTVCLGRRATLSDEQTLRGMVEGGSVPDGIGDCSEPEWAFTFHKG
jgi:hypothetical protein